MKKVLITIILVSFTVIGLAQVGGTGGQGAAQYVLGKDDQVLMPVNIWGFVNKPGRYMVPYKTDLISLITFAGGPEEHARVKSIKVVRGPETDDKGNITKEGFVIDVNVKEYIKNGTFSQIPVLKPNDTIVVNGTTFNFILQSFEFIVKIASIAQIYALARYYTSRAD